MVDFRIWSDTVAAEDILRGLKFDVSPETVKPSTALDRPSSRSKYYVSWRLSQAGTHASKELDLAAVTEKVLKNAATIKTLIQQGCEVMLQVALTADDARSYNVSIGDLAQLEAIGIKIVITAY